jgi:hypothetical protein
LRVLSGIIQAVRRMRMVLALVALVYVVSCLVGWYLGSVQSLLALEMRLPIEQAGTSMQQFFNSILRGLILVLIPPSLRTVAVPIGYIILIIFAVALIRTFVTTTLPGIIPLLGAAIIVAVSWIEGFMIGLFTLEPLTEQLHYSAGLNYAGLAGNIVVAIIGLFANVLAAAAGVNLAIASAYPRRYNTQSRLAAFTRAWKDAARIYVIVILLFVLYAILEVTAPFLLAS